MTQSILSFGKLYCQQTGPKKRKFLKPGIGSFSAAALDVLGIGAFAMLVTVLLVIVLYPQVDCTKFLVQQQVTGGW